ncbi:MAG TPA: GNAT family protein [Actinomycetota bacterium]
MNEGRDGDVGMIEGRRVHLRPVEERDYPLIHRWMNHPEVWHYMDYERPVSLADVAEDVERSRSEGFPFTVVVEGQPIGRIGLNQLRRRDRRCSLYMFIGEPAYWGQGLARDATMTLLRYAFERWDLHQVELWTLADNDRAIAAYQRCGFTVEATLRDRSWKDGAWVDHVLMSVTREEFEPAYQDWSNTADR